MPRMILLLAVAAAIAGAVLAGCAQQVKPAPPRKGSIVVVAAADGKPVAGALVAVRASSSVYDLDGSLGSQKTVRSHHLLAVTDATGTVVVPEKFWQEETLGVFACAPGFEPIDASTTINQPGLPIGVSQRLHRPEKYPNFTMFSKLPDFSTLVTGSSKSHGKGTNTVELSPLGKEPEAASRYREGLRRACEALTRPLSPDSPAPIDPAPWQAELARAEQAVQAAGEFPSMRYDRGDVTLHVKCSRDGKPVERFWVLVWTWDKVKGPSGAERRVPGPVAGIYPSTSAGVATIPAHANTTYDVQASVVPDGMLTAEHWFAASGYLGRSGPNSMLVHSLTHMVAVDKADGRPLQPIRSRLANERKLVETMREALADDSPWATREGREHLDAVEAAVASREAWFARAAGS